MSDMLAIFGTLLIMGLAFPALLFVAWLSFPVAVDNAQLRVATSPLRCFGIGLAILLLLTLPLLALFNSPGPGQFLAGVIILVVLTLSTIGAAGMAAQLGERLKARNQGQLSAHAAFLYGATVLELTVAFPIIGWLLLLPLAIILALGTTTYALLRRRPRLVKLPESALSPAAVAPTTLVQGQG